MKKKILDGKMAKEYAIGAGLLVLVLGLPQTRNMVGGVIGKVQDTFDGIFQKG